MKEQCGGCNSCDGQCLRMILFDLHLCLTQGVHAPKVEMAHATDSSPMASGPKLNFQQVGSKMLMALEWTQPLATCT